LPWGALRGVAVDADPRVVELLRASAVLNGLAPAQHGANTSSLDVRLLLLSDSDGEEEVGLDEHIGVVTGRGRSLRVRKRTLDNEFADLDGDIGILSIHGNGFFEEQILRGAAGFLSAGRIRCILVTCPAEGCADVENLLKSFHYETDDLGDWVRAAPLSQLADDQASICAPHAHSGVQRMDL